MFVLENNEIPPHKKWVLFKVKYPDLGWNVTYRAGYAKHYQNGEVMIVIPEVDSTGKRVIEGWFHLPEETS